MLLYRSRYCQHVSVIILFIFLLNFHMNLYGSDGGNSDMDTISVRPIVIERYNEYGIIRDRGFFENKGQVQDPRIYYYYSSENHERILFMESEVLFSFVNIDSDIGSGIQSINEHVDKGAGSWDYSVRFTFVGSNNVTPIASNKLNWSSNYYYGPIIEKWVTNVSLYSNIHYPNLYHNIDLLYSISQHEVKYSFIVHPGGNPREIKIRVEGNSELSLDTFNNLVISTPVGDIVDENLIVTYSNDKEHVIRSEFQILSTDTYTFSLGEYDTDRKIIIDPMVYSSTIGGYYLDSGVSVTLTDDGNIILLGRTSSSDFPTTTGAYQRNYSNMDDLYICMVNLSRAEIEFSTYIGGERDESPSDIAIDDDGNIYIVGSTDSDDFPTTTGAFQTHHQGRWDVFACKLSSDGKDLLFSTLVGSRNNDFGEGISVDTNGTTYITGSTDSTDFNTTPDAIYPDYIGGVKDGFFFRLNPDGSRLDYSSYIGGSRNDACYDIELGKDDFFYLTGGTNSTDCPITSDALQSRYRGGLREVFITKIDVNGSEIEYSTFIGGTGDWPYGIDIGRSIDIDTDGNILVTGETSSLDFPTTRDAYMSRYQGGMSDAFVLKIDGTGNLITFSTFFGGNGRDEAFDIAVDSRGYPYITGLTDESGVPTTLNSFQESGGGLIDGFVARFSPDGERLIYSSLLGGSNNDIGYGVAVDEKEHVVVTGLASSTDFPTTPDAMYYPKGHDAFFCRLTTDVIRPIADAGPDQEVDQYQVVKFDCKGSWDDIAIGNWTWSFKYADNVVELFGPANSFQFMEAGDYKVLLNISDRAGNWATDLLNITVRDITPPDADAGENITIDQYQEVHFNGSESRDNVDIVNFTWKLTYDNQSIELYGSTPSYSFEIVGIYRVGLTVTDVSGHSALDHVYVTVRDITNPVPYAGEDISVFQYQRVILDSTSSYDNVGITKWTWSFQYNETDYHLDGPEVYFTFSIPGQYIIILNVSDEAGNWAIDSVQITVVDIIAPIANAGEDIEQVQFQTARLDGGNSTDNVGISNWTWTFNYSGDDHVLFGRNTSFQFDLAGVVDIILNVSDSQGNWDTDSMTVTILDSVDPFAEAGPDVEINQGITVSLNGHGSTDNVRIVNWTWIFTYEGMDYSLYGPTHNFTFMHVGTVRIILSVKDESGNNDTDELIIIVKDVTPPIARAGSNISVQVREPIVLNGTISTDNVEITKWIWTFEYKGNTITLDGPVQQFTFDEVGVYRIKLTVEDGAGNIDMDHIYVEVNSVSFTLSGISIIIIIVVCIIGIISAIYLYKLKSR